MVFVIPAPAVAAIRSHAAAEYPREGCGLLVGRDRSGERRVAYAVPTRNDHPQAARRYTIAPEDLLIAEKQARQAGLEVVGFYHSHPDVDPRPSASDTTAAWPHYTYVIVGVRAGRAGEIAAWRLRGEELVAEPLEVTAESEARS